MRNPIGVTGPPSPLVRRSMRSPCVEIHIVNCDFDIAAKPAEGSDSRCQLLPYRKYIKLLSVGGAILPLLSSQGGSATLRWASSSNRIDLENANPARLRERLAAMPNAPSNYREDL
jgi:hypothetical protein